MRKLKPKEFTKKSYNKNPDILVHFFYFAQFLLIYFALRFARIIRYWLFIFKQLGYLNITLLYYRFTFVEF